MNWYCPNKQPGKLFLAIWFPVSVTGIFLTYFSVETASISDFCSQCASHHTAFCLRIVGGMGVNAAASAFVPDRGICPWLHRADNLPLLTGREETGNRNTDFRPDLSCW